MNMEQPLNFTALIEVGNERRHQVEDLGFDLAHDQRIGRTGFGYLLARRALELLAPPPIEVDARRLLVEIAAIAVGGIEAIDATPPVVEEETEPMTWG